LQVRALTSNKGASEVRALHSLLRPLRAEPSRPAHSFGLSRKPAAPPRAARSAYEFAVHRLCRVHAPLGATVQQTKPEMVKGPLMV